MNDPALAEAELQDLVASCYDDPLKYVMAAFDWDEGDLTGFLGPDDWQVKFLRSVGKQVRENKFDGRLPAPPIQEARGSGHGIGKSALVAWLILWIMSTRPYCKGTITANTLPQLETKTWAELAKWHKRAINGHWFVWQGSRNALKFYHRDYPEEWACTGQTCREENSEAFAGQHAATSTSFYIFDEASAIPDKIWEVAEGGITDGEPMWFAFGNPTRNTGRFYEITFGKLRHRWRHASIDSRDVAITNKAQLQKWVDDYGEDSDFVRVRVRGLPPRAGSAQFVPMDLVTEAMSRPLTEDTGAAMVVGVDVARFGDDQSVIFTRCGRDARSIPPLMFRGLTTMQLADKVASHIRTYHPDAVFVDGVGVGGGVVDRLRQLGFRVIEVNVGERANDTASYANQRIEVWARMRDWLRGGCLPSLPLLRDELVAPEFAFDASNRLRLERKEDMKRRGVDSPDVADALALTFSSEVRRRDVNEHRTVFADAHYETLEGVPTDSTGRQRVADSDYSSFG